MLAGGSTSEACEDACLGSRNGYREVTVKTTAGPVQLARPKLRGTVGAFGPMTTYGWFAPVWGTGYLAPAGGPGETRLRPVERGLASNWLRTPSDARWAKTGRVFEVARAEAISASAAEDGQVDFSHAAGVVDEVDRNDLCVGDRERHE